MLNLHTLMRAVPANIVDNSLQVKVLKQSAYEDTDDNGTHKVYNATCRTQLPGKEKRYVTIKLYGTMHVSGRMKNKTKHRCWVHCSCEYFLYYLEVALAARGSSHVINSNGAFPKVRNMRMRPYLCKHLLAASREAWKIRPSRRKPAQISPIEFDKMVQMVSPFIPR